MRLTAFISALLCAVAIPLSAAQAWWDEGHMQIAYVAYKRLDPAVKDKVDALLKLNPDYNTWTAGAANADTARLYAFVHAATWADDIKTKEGYSKDRVTDAEAGQNIGYSDHKIHDFWHYKDISYSPDGTPLPPQAPVDAVTQLKLFTTMLPASSGASDDVRSYDLVWILHLVGDIHQPLHAIERYTKEIAGGDTGGNTETVIPATGQTIALHLYWDGVFGGYSSPFGAIYDASAKDGLASVTANAVAAQVSDPEIWAQESAALARQFAYAPPVSSGPDTVFLTREYETNARNIARNQAALAAARLANLLNAALK